MARYFLLFLFLTLMGFKSPPRKVEVYFFLSSTCKICQGYSLEIRNLEKEFAPLGVEFQAFFPGRLESDSTVNAFLEKYELKLRGSVDTTMHYQWNATVTPEVFLWVEDTLAYHGRIDDSYESIGKKRYKTKHRDFRDNLNNILEGKDLISTFVQPVGCIIEK